MRLNERPRNFFSSLSETKEDIFDKEEVGLVLQGIDFGGIGGEEMRVEGIGG